MGKSSNLLDILDVRRNVLSLDNPRAFPSETLECSRKDLGRAGGMDRPGVRPGSFEARTPKSTGAETLPAQIAKQVDRRVYKHNEKGEYVCTTCLGHSEAHFHLTHAKNKPEADKRQTYVDAMVRLKESISRLEKNMVQLGALSASTIQANKITSGTIAAKKITAEPLGMSAARWADEEARARAAGARSRASQARRDSCHGGPC